MKRQPVGKRLKRVWYRTPSIVILVLILTAITELAENQGSPIWGASVLLPVILIALGVLLSINLIATGLIIWTRRTWK